MIQKNKTNIITSHILVYSLIAWVSIWWFLLQKKYSNANLDTNNQEYQLQNIENQVIQEPYKPAINRKSINVSFCNNSTDQNVTISKSKKSASIKTLPWKNVEVCLRFFNDGNEDYWFWVNFVDGYENDQWYQWCWLETAQSNFGSFVTNYEASHILKPWEEVIIRPTLNLPWDKIGKQIWCFTVIPDTHSAANLPSWWTRTLPRRSWVIEVLNEWEITVNLTLGGEWIQEDENTFYVDDIIRIQKESNWIFSQPNFTLELPVINNGGVKENFIIQTNGIDVLGNTYTWTTLDRGLSPTQKDIYKTALTIPRYQMRYTVQIDIEHTPDIAWISQDMINGYYETQTFTHTARVFIMPRCMISRLLLLLLIIYIITRYLMNKKNKKHHNKDQNHTTADSISHKSNEQTNNVSSENTSA